jgi:D-serine deaminase-like pyridoxal phosphate-dependent protein
MGAHRAGARAEKSKLRLALYAILRKHRPSTFLGSYCAACGQSLDCPARAEAKASLRALASRSAKPQIEAKR